MTQKSSANPLTVVLEIPDRQALIELLSTIEDADSRVRTQDIRQTTESRDGTVNIDFSELTAKQQTALELAVESGYYERPRGIDLDELGEQLGISKSAVSQRIRAAERKLIETAIRQCG